MKSANSNNNNNNNNPLGNGEIVVAVRIRPLSSKETQSGHKPCCDALVEESAVVIRKKADDKNYLKSQMGCCNEYQFDHVFDESSTQYEIFSKTAKPIIAEVLKGFNGTIFAYGATGAGKTYTMLGDLKSDSSSSQNDNSGIIPNTVQELIHIVKQQQMSKDIYINQISISVSYFEVYNEQVYDLLDNEGKLLALREDQDKGIVVAAGATEIVVESVQHVMDLLVKGNKHRKTEATQANAVSSRSHAIFQLSINQTRYSSVGQAYNVTSKLSLIDLAGSERASATNNRGIRLVEGANINKSLLALANCINALSENGVNTRHVKYRDSKLTHLLKSSLEGNCRLVMIANVNPTEQVYEDSHNTLKYANRAKSIKINPEIKEYLKKGDFAERETRLKEENGYLRGKVADLEQLVDVLQKKIESLEHTIQVSTAAAAAAANNRQSMRRMSPSAMTSFQSKRKSTKRSMGDGVNSIEDKENSPNRSLQNSPTLQSIYEGPSGNNAFSESNPNKRTRPSLELQLNAGKSFQSIIGDNIAKAMESSKQSNSNLGRKIMASRSLSPQRNVPKAKRKSPPSKKTNIAKPMETSRSASPMSLRPNYNLRSNTASNNEARRPSPYRGGLYGL